MPPRTHSPWGTRGQSFSGNFVVGWKLLNCVWGSCSGGTAAVLMTRCVPGQSSECRGSDVQYLLCCSRPGSGVLSVVIFVWQMPKLIFLCIWDSKSTFLALISTYFLIKPLWTVIDPTVCLSLAMPCASLVAQNVPTFGRIGRVFSCLHCFEWRWKFMGPWSVFLLFLG